MTLTPQRLDRNAQGSRMPETKMERLQEEEWDSDDKTVAFGSVNSTFNAKIEPPTPPSEPPAGPGVTPRPHAE
jgi:hypothetical protein